MTGARDGFGVHTADYYRRAYALFTPTGPCALLLAEYDGTAAGRGHGVSAAASQGWYLYGASSDRERNRMAPYLAQWEAHALGQGTGRRPATTCGACPTHDEAALEAGFRARATTACGECTASSAALAGNWCAPWAPGTGCTTPCSTAPTCSTSSAEGLALG